MNTLHDGFEWKEDTQAVFEKAVRNGVLSPATVGDYMYMGTVNGQDQFKHRMTRQYLKQEVAS